MNNCAQRYHKLTADREIYLDRARECSELTLPSLITPEGFSSATDLYQPFQSTGARGVNNLASKLLLLLFPPNSPFFRLAMDTKTKAELDNDGQLRAQIEQGLAGIEREVMGEIENSAMRVHVFEALKHLIVSGNTLVHLPKKGGIRVFPLSSYVCKRDPNGELLEVIVEEVISPKVLPKDMEGVNYEGEEVKIYTKVERTSESEYYIYQEVGGVLVPNSEGTYKKELLPWRALRMVHIDGENYGRSYTEEYLGDLKSLEGLMESIVSCAAASSKLVFLVRPNASVKRRDLAQAKNGSIIVGQPEDVKVLQTEKSNDMRVVLETVKRIEERLAFAFLLNTSIQRDAERVTAEEIRFMAQELESALGGVYSVLSQEMQLPIVNIMLDRLSSKNKIPKLPKGTVTPVIVTGVEALGRGNDLNKLRGYIQDLMQLAQANPQAIQMINFSDLVARLATGHGIDTIGLIKTPEQMQQEQQAAAQSQQEQMMQQTMMSAAPGVAKEMVKNNKDMSPEQMAEMTQQQTEE
tara:strand:+ start:12475 stop:14043 length:1569 start_codon:yes stop_codon:yes gene_type:complete